MFENILSKAGLTTKEAHIYELLLSKGELKATQIAIETDLKRSLVYKLLADLQDKKLVEKDEPTGKVAKFRAKHPNSLRELAQENEQSAIVAKTAINDILPNLLSSFNLSAGKPGVRFFEGVEGIKQVWWDTLAQNEEVLTIGDLEFLINNFEKINQEFLKERQKKQIKKRAITNDSEFNRNIVKNYDSSELTETRLIGGAPANFASVIMQIYAGKISFTSMSKESMIGVIIEDKQIFEMNKNLFELLWSQAKKIEELKPKSIYDIGI